MYISYLYRFEEHIHCLYSPFLYLFLFTVLSNCSKDSSEGAGLQVIYIMSQCGGHQVTFM